MYDLTFVLPGDSFVASRQSAHFKRGKAYKVKDVTIHNGYVVIAMADEHGQTVPYAEFDWDLDGKTVEKLDERRFKARLQFFFKNKVERIAWQKNIYDLSECFDISFAYFSNHPDAIAGISRFELVQPGISKNGETSSSPRYYYFGEKILIKNEQEYYDYFYKLIQEKNASIDSALYHLSLPGGGLKENAAIDAASYVRYSNLQRYDDLNPSAYWYNDIDLTTTRDHLDDSFEDFVKFLFRFIMTKEKGYEFENINEHERTIIQDVIDLFVMLPSSYGPTAISKLLCAKSKLDHAKYDPYREKYKKVFKQIEIFELVSSLESYLYKQGVFHTKESYSSSTEWRGRFEYIGSKYVNKEKLEELKSELIKILNV